MTISGDTQVGSGSHRQRHSRPRALGASVGDRYFVFLTAMTSKTKKGWTWSTHPSPSPPHPSPSTPRSLPYDPLEALVGMANCVTSSVMKEGSFGRSREGCRSRSEKPPGWQGLKIAHAAEATGADLFVRSLVVAWFLVPHPIPTSGQNPFVQCSPMSHIFSPPHNPPLQKDRERCPCNDRRAPYFALDRVPVRK